MRFDYTDEQIEFLRREYPNLSRRELTDAFNDHFALNKTENSIKNALKKHGIKCDRIAGNIMKGKSTLFTAPQVAFIKANYAAMGRKGLLAALNSEFAMDVTLQQLVSFVKNHKINSGRTGHFQKGNIPWSQGTKGVLKPNSGSFKQGNKPHNHKPIGHERIDNRDGYIMVKVADKNPWKSSESGWYRAKHNIVWEQHHGPIPDGMCIRFKDGNPQNCTIENLLMVSRAEHIRLTQLNFAQQPEEIKPLIVNIAKIEQAVYERVNS